VDVNGTLDLGTFDLVIRMFLYVRNTLILYAVCGNMVSACKVFD
jgi:hypothetical protein